MFLRYSTYYLDDRYVKGMDNDMQKLNEITYRDIRYNILVP